MTEITNYRRLGRNGSSPFQRARSLSTFVLLIVVVVCVFFAYQYVSNSAELNTFRVDFEQSNALNVKLKNELLELNVKLEKLALSEQQCREKAEESNKNLQVCQTENAKNIRLAAARMDSKEHCEKNVSDLRTQLNSTKSQMEVQKQIHVDQITNLTQTVQRLRGELAILRHQNPAGSDNSTDTAPVNATDTQTRQQSEQLTAPVSTNNNSSRTMSEDEQIEHVAPEARSEPLLQVKRKLHAVQNDARERLDESELPQQPHKQKESDNDKGTDNDQEERQQQHFMGAGGRVRLEEMAAEAAKRDDNAGGNVRGELLQAAAAAAQQKEENNKEHDKEVEEQDGGEVVVKDGGEADKVPGNRKTEQQQSVQDEGEEP